MVLCHLSKWPCEWVLGPLLGYGPLLIAGRGPLCTMSHEPPSHFSMDFFGIRPPGLQRSDDSNSKPQWQAGQTSRDTPQNQAKRDGKRNITGSPRRPLKLFYGTSIAGRLPPPTPPAETTFSWAERNTWRQIYQDMADGLPLRQPLRPPGRIKLFWTRDNAHIEDD